MKWTTQPPTLPGWYWARVRDPEAYRPPVQVVRLFSYDDGYRCAYFASDDADYTLDFFSAWSDGRIQEPDEG